MASATTNSSNLFDLDYHKEAASFTHYTGPITDVHCHITGNEAAQLAKDIYQLYGVTSIISMTPLEQVDSVRNIFGDKISFIAVPKFYSDDPLFEHGIGYCDRIRAFYKKGARIAKFFCGPRLLDSISEDYESHPLRLDSPVRRAAIDVAVELGMSLMIHIADPDVWFAARYKPVERYGSKKQQYEMLEWLLENYEVPVIAAHMGGSPEHLPRLVDLLTRHPNLYLDCSAVKWQIRELSKHPAAERIEFFTRFQDRILFGSDIVTTDDHLSLGGEGEISTKARSKQEAFDLYASRLWALRTMFEKDFDGPSPIDDPDCLMAGETSPPRLLSAKLPQEVLNKLYHKNCVDFLTKAGSYV